MRKLRRILQDLEQGREVPSEELTALLYDELHQIARREMARERSDHTLQPTALAHEAYLRLAGGSGSGFACRGEFLAAAAVAIRRVLVEHARRRARLKRGGDRGRVDLEGIDPAGPVPDETLLDLDEAVRGLSGISPEYARTVELRFFAGMTVDEIAAHRGVSASTIGRELRFARAWLRGELGGRMDRDSSRRLVELFQRAVDLDPEQRDALLSRECAGDSTLRERVERLLRDDAAEASVLDHFDGLRELTRSDPILGRELGPYRLTSLIARGGMGVVYRAVRTDGAFDRDVAIKLVQIGLATEETRGRFERERHALARLDHENIARLYDGGTAPDGRPYLVMEFVEGLPVDEYCDVHSLGIRERLDLFVSICRAVHCAHQNLIVHRDLKPSNVLVDDRGVPKLLDFGIAQVVETDEGAETAERTRTLQRLLTPEYASPEQLAGERVTTATDVYSLGVVLYTLLTGRRPFRRTTITPFGWDRSLLERTPTRPSALVGRPLSGEGEPPLDPEELARRRGTTPARLRRRLAGDLDRIVLMALRREPERRYHSAVELADDVERHLQGHPVLARGNSLAYLVTGFARQYRTLVGAGVAVLLALVVGLVLAWRGEHRARHQAEHARIEATSFQHMARFLTETFLDTRAMDDEQRRSAGEDVKRYAAVVRIEYADQDHLQANLLDALGDVCVELGLLERGEALIREAMGIRLDSFGEESIEVALSLESLGLLSHRRGDFETAARHLRDSLALHRSCPPNTHTDIATVSNNLAVVLRNLGETEEAERLFSSP